MALTTTDKMRLRSAFANDGTADRVIEILDTASPAEIAVIDGVTAGVATASKALVIGASKEIATITSATITTLTGSVHVFNGATGVNEVQIPTNLADALSIESSAGDILVIDTTTGAVAMTITTSAAAGLTLAGHVTIGDAKNIILNTTTGTKIGTAAGQKLGFFGATPVIQATAYTQTYSTADKTHAAPTAAVLTVTDGAGTNDGTIGAITGDASVIAAVQELADQINKLVADLADVKQLVNSVIDDLQAFGLLS